ncbi:hypothetical protein M422DRAFT_248703 [Sphaerobolus stellatus SS14]|nr:hypothetical protein M422DRAFT_248703 [Sphaerobolus stellatus SS14]
MAQKRGMSELYGRFMVFPKSLRDHETALETDVEMSQKRPTLTSPITIFVPIDRSIRQAIIIPVAGRPHNHPSFPLHKLTYEAKLKYESAVEQAGIVGATVRKVDSAQTTEEIFNNPLPQTTYPVLANPRIKADIIKKQKKKENPYGLGYLGVVSRFQEEQKKPMNERYIQCVLSEASEDGDGMVEVVVTMHPELIKHVHSAQYTVHDTTYKQICGEHNEWEVVMFMNGSSDVRLNIACLYSSRETRQAYRLMWSAYFRTIERMMGQKLNIKCLHGVDNLAVILTDGHPGQALGLGDALLELNDPAISGITTTDPAEILYTSDM